MKRISVPQAIAIIVVLIFTLYLAMIAECAADDGFFQTDQKPTASVGLGAADPPPVPTADPTPPEDRVAAKKQRLEFLSPEGSVIEWIEFDGAIYFVAWDEKAHGWELRNRHGAKEPRIYAWGSPNWRVRDKQAPAMVRSTKEPTPKIPTVKTAQKQKVLGIMDINGPDFKSPQTTPRRALSGRKP